MGIQRAMRLFYPPLVIRAGLNVNHLPGYSFKDLSPSWQTGSRLALHAIGATAGNPPKAPPERRRPRPGEGQGEPVNAAAMGNACPLPRVRPTDRPTAVNARESAQTVPRHGRAKLSRSSLPPSLQQSGRSPGKRGDKSVPLDVQREFFTRMFRQAQRVRP